MMGIPPEDFELVRRKTEAIAIEVLGFLTSFVGGPFVFFLGILGNSRESFGFGVILGGFLFLGGLGVAAYGDYLARKYTHILWTKQALREHEEEKLGLKKEFRSYRDFGILDVIRDKGLVGTASLGFSSLAGSIGAKKGQQPTFQPPSATPRLYKPREVEILPEETSYSKLITMKNETLEALENLKKRLIEGKISEETYKELRKELEERLNQTDFKLKELQTFNVCPACGARLTQDAKFCIKCGKSVQVI